MKLKNNVKGITLIALVVTIIVLLILAGVALNLTIGQNGIFTRAEDAANIWRNAESNEQLAMGELEDWMDSVSGESSDETEPAYTNIFAQLYSNGDGTETLIFTNDDSYREEGLTYEQSYDITDKHFGAETGIIPPWIDDINTSIIKAKIANEIKPKYTSFMFAHLTSLENIEGIENLNTENTEDMSWMFCNDTSLKSIDLSGFNTGKVTDMSLMFAYCSNLTSINLTNFDTKKVTLMNGMFAYCSNLSSLILSGLETINVTDMTGMFAFCTKLTNLDLSSFKTINVKSMRNMFVGCNNLTNLDLINFDTSNVDNMETMFVGCKNLTSLDLSSFDTRNVTNMSGMFNNCTNLLTIYVGQNWKIAENADGMFDGCIAQEVTPKS